MATCKGKKAGTYDPKDQEVTPTLPANMPDDPTRGNENAGQQYIEAATPQIYDARVTAKKHTFLDHEHHVTMTAEGTVEQTDGSQGPHGDFSIYSGN